VHLVCFVYRPGTPSYRWHLLRSRFPVSVYSRRVQNQDPCERSAILHGQSSRALTAIGIFLFFGAIMACLAGTTLLCRGTVLERMWTLNSSAFKQLVPFGTAAGIVFILLGVTLAVAGTGWFKRRLWAWRASGGHHRHTGLGRPCQCRKGRSREGRDWLHNCRCAAFLSSAFRG
jgi:hypothetical protein